jgi:hypothetical protein
VAEKHGKLTLDSNVINDIGDARRRLSMARVEVIFA